MHNLLFTGMNYYDDWEMPVKRRMSQIVGDKTDMDISSAVGKYPGFNPRIWAQVWLLFLNSLGRVGPYGGLRLVWWMGICTSFLDQVVNCTMIQSSIFFPPASVTSNAVDGGSSVSSCHRVEVPSTLESCPHPTPSWTVIEKWAFAVLCSWGFMDAYYYNIT